jgi:hypothetical protein
MTCCSDGCCLICRADWAELAKRVRAAGHLSETDREMIEGRRPRTLQTCTCHRPDCDRVFVPYTSRQIYCSRKCQKVQDNRGRKMRRQQQSSEAAL